MSENYAVVLKRLWTAEIKEILLPATISKFKNKITTSSTIEMSYIKLRRI